MYCLANREEAVKSAGDQKNRTMIRIVLYNKNPLSLNIASLIYHRASDAHSLCVIVRKNKLFCQILYSLDRAWIVDKKSKIKTERHKKIWKKFLLKSAVQLKFLISLQTLTYAPLNRFLLDFPLVAAPDKQLCIDNRTNRLHWQSIASKECKAMWSSGLIQQVKEHNVKLLNSRFDSSSWPCLSKLSQH